MALLVSFFGSVLAEGPEAVRQGVIKSDRVNLRSAPDLSSTIITTLPKNTEVTILAHDPTWYKVRLSDNREGWVAGDYVALYSSPLNRGKGYVDLISFAKNFLRANYIYGGATPTGFDCSGFTQYIFSKFGFSLPHNAADQAKIGIPVSKAELLPGDLVFFITENSIIVNHVGIYIGNNQFIHASSALGEVTITSLNTHYYQTHFNSAKRIFQSGKLELDGEWKRVKGKE